jgi:hypothetical protein
MKQILFFLVLSVPFLTFGQLQVNVIQLTTNDLVYDTNTNRIYASIPSANGANGNSIGIINPNTYILEETVFIGSEPSEMAISDNGEFIYTGFLSSATVRRFKIATKTAEIQFPLGSDSFSGPFFAYDLSVMPGNSHAVAVSRRVQNSTGFYGVAIYDDGIPRPTTTISTFPNNDSYVINFTSPTSMYGFNNQSTGFDLNRLSVNNGGVTEISNTGSIVYNFSINNFIVKNNRLYFDFGSIIDVTNSPFNIGQFSGANGRVMYDNYNNLVCFATYDSGGNIIFKRFNPNTFLLVDSKIVNQAYGSVKHIISCGNGCYAFNTNDNNVVVIKDNNLGLIDVNNSSLAVYPNPTSDNLFIDTEKHIKEIIITDINGRLINNLFLQDNKIDLSEIQSGIYLVKFVDKDGNFEIKKIIKK